VHGAVFANQGTSFMNAGAIAVQALLALGLSQGAGYVSKTSSARIAVQFLLALDHESGCRNVFEGTLRRITAYRTAIKLYFEQDASSQKP
jgi:hypothetical protein